MFFWDPRLIDFRVSPPFLVAQFTMPITWPTWWMCLKTGDSSMLGWKLMKKSKKSLGIGAQPHVPPKKMASDSCGGPMVFLSCWLLCPMAHKKGTKMPKNAQKDTKTSCLDSLALVVKPAIFCKKPWAWQYSRCQVLGRQSPIPPFFLSPSGSEYLWRDKPDSWKTWFWLMIYLSIHPRIDIDTNNMSTQISIAKN